MPISKQNFVSTHLLSYFFLIITKILRSLKKIYFCIGLIGKLFTFAGKNIGSRWESGSN